jgi:BMFP domain-containing protein YqiC
MTQTSNRIFDDFTKLMTDAAGAAEGMKQEAQALFKSQSERFLRDMDVVTREDFEAVNAMAQKAREENEALSQRIAKLEALLAGGRSA